MGIAVFSKVNMATVPNPPVNTVVIGVDLDGLTKQKDSLGTITILSEPMSRLSLTLGIIDMSQLAPPTAGTMILAVDLDNQLKMLDENAILSPIGSGNTVSVLSITNVDLQNLISNDQIVPGQIYSITDAVEVDYTNTESLFVTGLTSSTIGLGVWNKRTNLYPVGKFSIHGGLTGTLGNINNIDINGNNLLTTSIPYNTSRYQTALDAANNINGGTPTHRWKAYVIEGYTVSDIATVILEYQGATNTNSTLTVSTTGTLLSVATGTNIVNPTNGQNSKLIELTVVYDVLNDKILNAKDAINNIEFSTSSVVSVKNFRWGDPRFINWKLQDVEFSNCWFLDSVKMANNQLSNVTFSNVAFGQFSDNIFVGGSFSEISAATPFNVQGNRCLSPNFSLNRIGSGRLASPTIKAGFNGNLIPASSTGGVATTTSISLSGSSGAQAFQFNNNTINGNTLVLNINNQCIISGNTTANLTISTCPGCTLSNNITSFNLTVSNTNLSTINISRNVFNGLMTISNLLGSITNISMLDNKIYNTFAISNSTLNGNINLSNNERLILSTGLNTFGAISIQNNSVANFNISGGSGKTFGIFNISNSVFYGISWASVVNANITISNSTIHSISLTMGDVDGAGTWTCSSSTISSGCMLTINKNGVINLSSVEMYPVSSLSATENTTMNISSTIFRQSSINEKMNCEVHYCDFTTSNFYNGGTTAVPVLDFVADYDLNNFTFSEIDTTGSTVDTSNGPSSVQLFSGDDETMNPGYLDYVVNVVKSGMLTFDWNYTATDDSNSSSMFVFLIDDVEYPITNLINSGGLNQTGNFSIQLGAGSIVGIRLYTFNDGVFVSNALINNWSFAEFVPSFLQCNATTAVDSSIYIAPAYNKYCDLGQSFIKTSTLNLSSKDSNSNIDFHGNVIFSTINMDDNLYLTFTDVDFKNAHVNWRTNGTTCSNIKIHNSSIRNRDFELGLRMGSIYLTNFVLEDSQIGFENEDSNAALPFKMTSHNTKITRLTGRTNLGSGEQIYFFTDEMNFQNEFCLTDSFINGRNFVYTQRIATPNGGNTITTFTSVIPGFVKTKVIMSCFNSNITANNSSNISVAYMDANGPVNNFSGTTTLASLDVAKYYENNTVDLPITNGNRSVFGVTIPSASLTNTSEIILAIEGYLADSTK
jgi:hypothetical protein